MSSPSAEPTHERARPQEPDFLRTGRLALIGLAVLVIFGITVLIADRLRARWSTEGAHAIAVPSRIGHEEINEIYQLPFPVERRGVHERLSQREWLHSWGWVDRSRGTVHMPIDVAIQEALGRGEKRGER